ncbi:MAG TPA: response regulator [Anaeromyxobacteraceae bacterium]|nr:response regulator [Anaeromyxobacteraceae bacterium]
MPCDGAILVVDDDPDNREAVAASFARLGCCVATARDGVDALEQLSRRRVCLVMLDMNMPRLDGAGFVRAVRGGVRPDLPIVTMSAGEDCVRPEAVRQHLKKPFDPEVLAGLAAGVCDQPRWLRCRGS